MKKKRIRFYQLGIAHTIAWVVWGSFPVGMMVYYIIMIATDGNDGYTKGWLYLPDWLMITLIGILLVAFFWGLCASNEYHIDFEDGKIKTEGDRVVSRTFRLQFKLSIKIKDITAIRVIKSNYNSLKKFSAALYNSVPHTYFEFTLSNGRTKWLYIHTYSKKQRIKMINIINGELGTNYDYVEMYKNVELIKGGSIFNRDHSKKKKKENSIHNDKNEI